MTATHHLRTATAPQCRLVGRPETREGRSGLPEDLPRHEALERVVHEEASAEADSVRDDVPDVDYVYVGPVEQERYDARRFTGRPGVTIAHESGNVTIYQIDADAACEATNIT